MPTVTISKRNGRIRKFYEFSKEETKVLKSIISYAITDSTTARQIQGSVVYSDEVIIMLKQLEKTLSE